VPVAIVGGGASGTILAAQLSRRGVSSLLIDGSGRAGHGIAYSTTEPAHLLNVRAEGMSAIAEDPDHFARHFEAEGGHRRDFAERRFFGRYLRGILESAIGLGHSDVDRASALQAHFAEGLWHIALDDGRVIRARALALAVGNQEPERLSAFAQSGDRYVNNPWGYAAQIAVRELVETQRPVLLLGTGLTMIDLALSLDAAGHRGRIVALSRRGQIPRAHGDFEPAPVDYEMLPSGNLIALWRWLRRRSAAVGWRAAIDSVRPHSHALWQSLGSEQQRRFLRHARPWWDVHRHRIAPQVADTIHAMIAEARLEIVAGRAIRSEAAGTGIEVEIRRRGAEVSSTELFDYVINCTGPLHAMDRTSDMLLRNLLDMDAVRPDHLNIGLEVDERSRAGNRLWALGPLTKGRYWEIIAVPDIRGQAAAVADDIARELEE
jgi:uncharacterized NAD(P)/FAD-binding protein YdhS